MVARKRSGRKAQQSQQPSEAAVATSPTAADMAAAPAAPAHGLRPSAEEVLAAVASLHADQLKPSGRILRKRLAERASGLAMEEIYSAAPAVGLAPLPEIDVAHLWTVCGACEQLHVEADEGGDWSATIVGLPTDFVNVHSVEDSYPPDLWQAAETYFLSLDGSEMKLPGGRYACAQALLGRKLEFLEGRSLGQVCHIVQLAISERKILGYCNGTVVPYGHSQSMLKERCAEQQQPIASPTARAAAEAAGGAPAMPLATWEVARRLLREILEEAAQPGQGPPVVPLSNVKRLFRSRYQTELSETMLGHSRMADLMQDERFQDLCTLRLQKGGYVVIGNDISPSSKASPSSKTISLAETLQPRAPSPRSQQTQRPGAEAVISLASGLRLEEDEPLASTVATPPQRRNLQLAGGLPLGLGEPSRAAAAEQGHAQPLRLELCLGRATRWGDIEDTPPRQIDVARPSAPAVTAAAALPLATPLPSPGVAADDTVARWMRQPKRLSFCTGEPLRLEDASPVSSSESGLARASLPTPLPSPGEPASATVRRWAAAPRRAEFFPSAPAAVSAAPLTAPLGGLGLQLPAIGREETSSASSLDASPLGRERTPKAVAASRDATSAAEAVPRWCPDEPLVLEDAGGALVAMPTPMASPGEPGSATRRRWAAVPGGAPRRLEFFPEPDEEAFPFAAAARPESPCLLGRTSPDRKSSEGGFKLGWEASAGLSGGVRLLETLPSPQRKTQALRGGNTGKGWLPLARELCEGSAHGCPSSFVKNTFIHAKLPPPTPIAGAAARSHSLPKDLGSRRGEASSSPSTVQPTALSAVRAAGSRSPAAASGSGASSSPPPLELPIGRRTSAMVATPQQRGRFMMDEPVAVCSAATAASDFQLDSPAQPMDMPRWLAPSPRDHGLALVVRNTFLHSAPPPPTPAACTVRRSRSLSPGAARRGEGAGGAEVYWQSSSGAPFQADDGKALLAAGRREASRGEALPRFMPISPALAAASQAEPGNPLATPALAPCAAQRVVRLADHV